MASWIKTDQLLLYQDATLLHTRNQENDARGLHTVHGYSLGPEMHHYRCQDEYISATASERILDTL
jgi:hypothetical protein